MLISFRSVQVFFIHLAKNSNINLFHGCNIQPFHGALRVITKSSGFEIESCKMVVVRFERVDNTYQSITAHVNLTNIFKKIWKIKQKKQLSINQLNKAENVLGALAETNSESLFYENIGRVIKAYRPMIMYTSIFFTVVEYIYTDSGKKKNWYCNVEKPLGEVPEKVYFEFFKEFLYPTNFLNTSNFCQRLSKKSKLKLTPIEIFVNFFTFQQASIKIIIRGSKIGFNILFASRIAGLIHQVLFISFFDIKTKNPVIFFGTAFVSFILSYTIMNKVVSITCICVARSFYLSALIIQRIKFHFNSEHIKKNVS